MAKNEVDHYIFNPNSRGCVPKFPPRVDALLSACMSTLSINNEHSRKCLSGKPTLYQTANGKNCISD